MLLSWDDGAWVHIHSWSGCKKWFKAKLSSPEVCFHHSSQWWECNEDTIVLTFPHIQNSPWKASTKLIQFWSDQNCIFQQEKYSFPCRGEWNPSAVHSSHRLREDIIQKFPRSVPTQTSSGTARAIQNTFKNNYKRHLQLLSHLCSKNANALKFSVLPLFNKIAKLPVCAKCYSCTFLYSHESAIFPVPKINYHFSWDTLTWFTQLVYLIF